MDTASHTDFDIVLVPDGETRVVTRAKVDETLASSRVGLLVECAEERELARDATQIGVERTTNGLHDQGSIGSRHAARRQA